MSLNYITTYDFRRLFNNIQNNKKFACCPLATSEHSPSIPTLSHPPRTYKTCINCVPTSCPSKSPLVSANSPPEMPQLSHLSRQCIILLKHQTVKKSQKMILPRQAKSPQRLSASPPKGAQQVSLTIWTKKTIKSSKLLSTKKLRAPAQTMLIIKLIIRVTRQSHQWLCYLNRPVLPRPRAMATPSLNP